MENKVSKKECILKYALIAAIVFGVALFLTQALTIYDYATSEFGEDLLSNAAFVVLLVHSFVIAIATIAFGVLSYKKRQPCFLIIVFSILCYVLFGMSLSYGLAMSNISTVIMVLTILARMIMFASLTLFVVYFFQSKQDKQSVKQQPDKLKESPAKQSGGEILTECTKN